MQLDCSNFIYAYRYVYYNMPLQHLGSILHLILQVCPQNKMHFHNQYMPNPNAMLHSSVRIFSCYLIYSMQKTCSWESTPKANLFYQLTVIYCACHSICNYLGNNSYATKSKLIKWNFSYFWDLSCVAEEWLHFPMLPGFAPWRHIVNRNWQFVQCKSCSIPKNWVILTKMDLQLALTSFHILQCFLYFLLWDRLNFCWPNVHWIFGSKHMDCTNRCIIFLPLNKFHPCQVLLYNLISLLQTFDFLIPSFFVNFTPILKTMALGISPYGICEHFLALAI